MCVYIYIYIYVFANAPPTPGGVSPELNKLTRDIFCRPGNKATGCDVRKNIRHKDIRLTDKQKLAAIQTD